MESSLQNSLFSNGRCNRKLSIERLTGEQEEIAIDLSKEMAEDSKFWEEQSAAERDRILNQENWFVDKHSVYLQPWTPHFNPLPLAVYSSPIWVRLYNLPIEYWGNGFLGRIGRMLGTLLEIGMDDEEDLYKYARLRVVTIRRIPNFITLVTSNGEWKQQVEVEKEVRQCSRCGSKFHGVDDCQIFVRRAKPSFRRPTQNWRKKEE
ncbi:hypothetical protein SUGI_1119120 [Cryptomeria japonica]|nr:hypothetical protein SUGI_1119120 [Cryptomeria japonica]